MAVSTKVSKTGVWLLLGALAVAGAQSAACSSAFHSCRETRTCPKEPDVEAGAAGDESGGASGGAAHPAAGASGSGRGGAGGTTAESGGSGTDEAGGSGEPGQGGAGGGNAAGGSAGSGRGGAGGAGAGGSAGSGRGGAASAGSGGVSHGGASGAGAANGGAGGGGKGGGGSSSGGKGGSGGASGGTGGAADTTAPTIVSISPANLATGVKSTAQIKITFSEVMNSSAATQALQVGGFTASDLNTSWDASGKVLTVTPKAAFAYATGSSPAGTPATKYTVSVGTGATDLAGNALGGPFSSSFTTLRQISQSIASGAAAEYSTYGRALGYSPDFCPGIDPVWVTIWSAIASSGTSYVFIPFDTTVMGIASSISLESATFSATQVAPGGAFYSAHQVVLKRVAYQAIDNTVLSAPIIDNFGAFASSELSQPTANVLTELSIDLAAGVRQELFRLEPTGTADETQANFTCSGFFLNVVYLTP